MARLCLRWLVLLAALAAPCGRAEINTVMLRVEGLIVRYSDLSPNLLNSQTGLSGVNVLRGGEGATGIAAWSSVNGATIRGAGATNIGF